MILTALDRFGALIDRAFASRPSWIIIVQLFLGLGWARASVEKIINPQWWDGSSISTYVADHDAVTIGWYHPISNLVNSDAAWLWAAIVLALEVLIALALLTGRKVAPALMAAIFLNLNIVIVGQPNPSIFYLIMQIALGLWLIEEVASPSDRLRFVRNAAISAAIVGVACLPYISTLQPELVIEDPATVIASGAFCTAIACIVARQRILTSAEAQPIDLRSRPDSDRETTPSRH